MRVGERGYLGIPEMGRRVVAQLTQLKADDLAHEGASRWNTTIYKIRGKVL